jgi:hypothetical protein
MTLSTFPTFLAFLTQVQRFPVPVSNPWQGMEIARCRRRASSHRSTRNSDRSASALLAHAVPFLAVSRPAIVASRYQRKDATEFVRGLVARLTGNRAQASEH